MHFWQFRTYMTKTKWSPKCVCKPSVERSVASIPPSFRLNHGNFISSQPGAIKPPHTNGTICVDLLKGSIFKDQIKHVQWNLGVEKSSNIYQNTVEDSDTSDLCWPTHVTSVTLVSASSNFGACFLSCFRFSFMLVHNVHCRYFSGVSQLSNGAELTYWLSLLDAQLLRFQGIIAMSRDLGENLWIGGGVGVGCRITSR